ncbi:uncharacterized protein CXQ87_002690 [Candidozyma duobushaemuli]|nr:uncharacterized protein CXQ87_002690 [[Candida] duobushaemulonis]PVH14546.1 hypothetical protein CXQ87_002690 [[Candida] duobushaemulonis]
MSFAESYVLASKVRSKLTRQAANPKASLRSLVLQANMLDNLMDHIAVESDKRKAAPPAKVSFALPEKPQAPSVGPSVTEYEVDYDSASDDDDDYDFDDFNEGTHTVYYSSESDSDSDSDDYYYSSDEEEEEDLTPSSSYRHLPTIDLSDMHLHRSLSVIEEETEEMPELARSNSTSDSDSEIEDVAHAAVVSVADEEHIVKAPPKAPTQTASDVSAVSHPHIARHSRHNAVYSMEHVF